MSEGSWRGVLNDLVDSYIMHIGISTQWHHDKMVWRAWAKLLETHRLRALNSYRVTILSTLQRRLRLFLAAPVNVRFTFASNTRVACSPYDFAILMRQQVLEERGSETRSQHHVGVSECTGFGPAVSTYHGGCGVRIGGAPGIRAFRRPSLAHTASRALRRRKQRSDEDCW